MPDELVQTLNPKMIALLREAHELSDDALAHNTRRTYESLWKDFCAFCDHVSAPALPAHPATVVSYLMQLAPAQATNTLETKLAAIRHFHLEARVPDPTADSAVRKVLQGARRRYGAAPERKAAVERDILSAMLSAQPGTLTGARNRALLLVTWACDLRRSEAVALDVRDVQFLGDRMIVTVRHSKTDQRREGYEISVPRMDDSDLCPVTALFTWLTAAEITNGPLFRKIDRWGHISLRALTDQVVADLVKAAALALGLDPAAFAGHSLRRGLITQAARNEEQTGDIRKVSRHKSETMLDVYRADTEEAQMRVIGRALGKRDG